MIIALISAKNREDLEKLLKRIQDILYVDYKVYKSFVPYAEYEKLREKVYIEYKDKEKFTETGVETYLYLRQSEVERYRKYIIKDE